MRGLSEIAFVEPWGNAGDGRGAPYAPLTGKSSSLILTFSVSGGSADRFSISGGALFIRPFWDSPRGGERSRSRVGECVLELLPEAVILLGLATCGIGGIRGGGDFGRDDEVGGGGPKPESAGVTPPLFELRYSSDVLLLGGGGVPHDGRGDET
jgi:hypothetical protein